MSELTPQQCRSLLASGDVAHIGVLSDGEPYVTPMSYVMHGEELAFRTGPGRRMTALRDSQTVCVEVTRTRDHFGWESVVLWGAARLVEDPEERAQIVAALLAKYHTESLFGTGTSSPLSEDRFVVAIAPVRMFGRSSGEGVATQTRPGRL